MAKLQPVQEGDTPEGTLKEVLAEAHDLDGVVVIALRKDGTQFLNSSRMSFYEKTFLKCFWDAWVLRWFGGMQDK